MAGSDTFRGCAFQAAFSVSLALDVLDGAAAELTVEGDADVVDAELVDDSGGIVRAVQAKTKTEPHVWGPQQIADVVAKWLASKPSQDAPFEFVTDGSLGQTVVAKLAPALRRLAEDTATEADREYLSGLGLDVAEPALGLVRIQSRLPDGRALLERETLRLLELRERSQPLGVEQARDAIWRLFGETVLGSGEADIRHRTLSRAQIADLVGIDLATIDNAEGWSADIETAYRRAVAAMTPDPAWTLLNLLTADRPPALRFVTPSNPGEGEIAQSRPATSLLDRDDDVLLHGRAGAGKTTTLAQLRAEALERGLLPIALRVADYGIGELDSLLRRSLERTLGHGLAPGVVAELVGREQTIVLLDGAGELLPERRQALIDDVRDLRRRSPGARLVLAARDPAPFAAASLTGFVLESLNAESRREIASNLTPDGQALVGEIEDRLGEVVDNPLLFTMAVGLSASGTRARSRAELFDGFIEGLQGRKEGVQLSASARAACEQAAFDLRAEGRFSAERWWWLEQFTAARAELIARGTIAGDTTSAEELICELEALGLLQAVGEGTDLGLLHDVFCDWLASEAVRHGQRELQAPLGEEFEEIALFLAERGTLSREQQLVVASSAVAAVRCADAMPAAEVNPELTGAIWRVLREQLAASVREPLESLVPHVVAGDQVWAFLARADSEEPLTHAEESPISCLVRGDPSPFAAAVDLWLGVLRLTLAQGAPELPVRNPPEDKLAAVLEAAVRLRADAVEHLVTAIAPQLTDRVRRTIGPAGMRGWVLPAQDSPGPRGSDLGIKDHTVRFISTSGGTHIERVNNVEEIAEAETTGAMSVESYLRTPPGEAARNSVREALTKLMGRLDG